MDTCSELRLTAAELGCEGEVACLNPAETSLAVPSGFDTLARWTAEAAAAPAAAGAFAFELVAD